MWRAALGVVAGVVIWGVVVTVLNLGLRYGWPAYFAVEKAMTFTLPMMIARLTESGLSSLASGYAARRIARNNWSPLIAGIVLLAVFVPVHYSLWNRFPVWYHLTFLCSLVFLSVLGGMLSQKPAIAPQA